nr:hypothetical protein [Bacteroidales bacterium]
MIRILLFVNLLFTGYSAPASGPDTLISCHFSNLPFPAFSEHIYRETGIKIYFRESWISELKVTLDVDRISVISAVERALEGTGLEVSLWNNDLVLLPGEKLISELPRFETVHVPSDTTSSIDKTLTRSEERYLTGRKADVTETMQIGKRELSGSKAKVTIRGRITEQQTGVPVIGATMYLEELKS